jgi:hypothetical protein
MFERTQREVLIQEPVFGQHGCDPVLRYAIEQALRTGLRVPDRKGTAIGRAADSAGGTTRLKPAHRLLPWRRDASKICRAAMQPVVNEG